jgi:hypothetical protein
MLIFGCLLILLASLASTWSVLNLTRPSIMRAEAYRDGKWGAIFVEWSLALVGAVFIALGTNVSLGIIAFLGFWFSPSLLAPILVALGLWHKPPRE